METTERRLRLEDLAGCVALSRSANWNQNEADWRLMLELGHGWGVFAPDGTLAASTLVLPYGGRFAWVSMVLVLPAQRRKGYATKLLRVALDDLRRRGLTPMLDATPAGREVYLQEGFRDTWGFSRLRSSSSAPGEAAPGVRSLAAADWPSVLALDAPAFGASREPLLRVLAARLPAIVRKRLISETGMCALLCHVLYLILMDASGLHRYPLFTAHLHTLRTVHSIQQPSAFSHLKISTTLTPPFRKDGIIFHTSLPINVCNLLPHLTILLSR